MKRSELLNWLQQEYAEWEAFLAQIDPARMDQPGVAGHWSIKDIIAHLTDWTPWSIARLQAAQRGEPKPSPPWPVHLESDDEINAWIYEVNHGRTVREVLDESARVFQELLTAVAELPEDVRIEQIHEGDRVYYLVWLGDERFLPGEFFDHFHDDHESDIRAWLVEDL